MRDAIWLAILMLNVSALAVLLVTASGDSWTPGWIQSPVEHARE